MNMSRDIGKLVEEITPQMALDTLSSFQSEFPDIYKSAVDFFDLYENLTIRANVSSYIVKTHDEFIHSHDYRKMKGLQLYLANFLSPDVYATFRAMEEQYKHLPLDSNQ